MFDYEQEPLHWVNRLSFLSRKALGAAFRAAGHSVSPEEWAVLLVLWKYGPQTPGALADVTIKDKTTITRLIDGMVRKRLVERQSASKDRRSVILKVSAHGEAYKSQLMPVAARLVVASTADISAEDLETTTRTLRKMSERLAENAARSKTKEHHNADL